MWVVTRDSGSDVGGKAAAYPSTPGPSTQPPPSPLCPDLPFLPGAAGLCPSGAWEQLGWGWRQDFPAALTSPPVMVPTRHLRIPGLPHYKAHSTAGCAGETQGENLTRRLRVTSVTAVPCYSQFVRLQGELDAGIL